MFMNKINNAGVDPGFVDEHRVHVVLRLRDFPWGPLRRTGDLGQQPLDHQDRVRGYLNSIAPL